MKLDILIKKCFRYGWENICKIIYRLYYRVIKDKIRISSIQSIEDTIMIIIKERKSVSRFGDGEFKWMIGVPQTSFEEQSEELSKRLIEVIQSNEENHIICIAQALGGLENISKRATTYWEEMLGQCGRKIMKYLDTQRIYYNANITRFYLNDINKDRVKIRFELLKKIWDKRDVIIVEGKYSRLGVGNDLFDNTGSIRRILAPEKNAFSKYNDIFNCVKRWYKKDDLVLVALGPTATVLAYDLAKEKIQTVDIGHVDVEYEWFLKGANNKVALPGKSVNEAVDDRSKERIEEHIWKKYCSQIVEKIY